MFKKAIEYYKHNPEGYWFKRKIYGWGWVPVKWQGWVVVLVAVAFISGGIYISEIDNAPGVAVLGVLLGAAVIFGFGRWKGEKACWQWGLPDNGENSDNASSQDGSQ